MIVLLIQHLHGIVSLVFNTTHGDEGEYARLEGGEDEDGDAQFADDGQWVLRLAGLVLHMSAQL